jgi:hypothetical protein
MTRPPLAAVRLALLVAALAACGAAERPMAASATRAKFDLEGGFFDAPWPIETRRHADGTLDLAGFPNPRRQPMVSDYLASAEAARGGFSRNGVVYLPLTGPVRTATLSATAPTAAGPFVFLIDVDPKSPARGRRLPVVARFNTYAGAFFPKYTLAVAAYPGIVLRAANLYAAVVLRDIGDEAGRPLGVHPALRALWAGHAPAGGEALVPGFAALAETLATLGMRTADVAAATVFRTGDPAAGMLALQKSAAAWPLPASAYTLTRALRDYPTYCVLEGTTQVPIYNAGSPGTHDYAVPGSGRIRFTGGVPQVQWVETIRFSLAIPKRAQPAAGFPLLFYANGQGGTYTQIEDRGTLAEQAAQEENGRGPALYLAAAGIGALDIESATVGPRHPTGSYAGIDFFNAFNLDAFRDNIRQAASEFTVLPRVARRFDIDAGAFAACSGVTAPGGRVTFDPANFFFYGHSTGASIGDLVLGVEPAYRAGMLSGAGGSWLYNLALKEHPIKLSKVMSVALGLTPEEPLDMFHPLAAVFQTTVEEAEAMNFAPLWQADHAGKPAKDILLIEGVVDGYFLPRMVNALSMAAGLDLAGPAVDPLTREELALTGGTQVPFPAAPNRAGRMGHVVQFAADGFDGHYAPFELATAKHLYRCWFESLLAGAPRLAAPVADGLAACAEGP